MPRKPSNATGNGDGDNASPVAMSTSPSSSSTQRLSRPSSRSQLVGSPSASLPVPQIPARAQDGGNSPRNASPFLQPTSSSYASSSRPGSVSPAPTTTTTTDTPSPTPPLTDAQKAEIVRRHLLSAEDQSRVAAAESAQQNSSGANVASSAASVTSDSAAGTGAGAGGLALDEQYPTPYHLEGGDVVAGVYKWVADTAAGPDGGASLRRSKSMVSVTGADNGPTSRRTSINPATTGRPDMSGVSMSDADAGDDDDQDDSAMGVKAILEPGGFRRDFLVRKAQTAAASTSNSGQATPQGAAASYYGATAVNDDDSSQFSVPAMPAGRFKTRSFIDFLSLYGHFGGEDLEEIEEGDEDEEDELEYDAGPQIPPYQGVKGVRSRGLPEEEGATANGAGERTPLMRGRSTLKRSQSSRRGRSSNPDGSKGDATVTQAVLMLLKSFVGTGVLFLGKAFMNGGLLFSVIVLSFIALISLYSFLLLVKTRLVCHGSFGDIGGILYGKYMRWAILVSIVLSQIGFVAAYTIFVAENLQAFIMAVSNCRTYVSIALLILLQLVIFMPFAMIRNIQKLSGTALVADAFILFGLVYIFSNEIKVLADNGIADVVLFNRQDFPLLIGTAVFSFEGIGLVIPITESMKEPHRFPRVLTVVMIGVMALFAGGGALAYAAYGSKIQTVVFVNLPQDDKFVNAAQFLYSIAILLSTPLQLFPAVRIMENGIFSRSGKHSTKVKWQKNTFRSLVVVVCSLVAWVGANDLDKFVSLIGSLACVPLCFCYPALLHYKACAQTRKQKALDIALFIFGLFAMAYTTSNTIIMLTKGGESAPPTFGKCPPRG